jgi:predicted dienelactone hydrolase
MARLCVLCLAAMSLVGADASTGGGTVRPAVHPPFAVGLRVVTWTDRTRTIHLPHGRTEPRRLVTYIRYPAAGEPTGADLAGAPPARSAGPFPLVVFGHGFAVTPAVYAGLLRAWAAAGYVVAAPVFPLENANAPGGPDESDIVNQPADMSFVISRVLAAGASESGFLSGLVDPGRIAVAGHSDGGETALATAYDRDYRDPRIGAAIILSGATIPGSGRLVFPPHSPPLLATQGSADTLNRPRDTRAFFDVAAHPKFLLTLIGATHLPPYSFEQPQLSIVQRVTVAFLDHYFKGRPLAPLLEAGKVAGVSALTADP